jgi:hypothetical protein
MPVNPVHLGRSCDCEFVAPLYSCTSITSNLPEDMANVCGVQQTFLGGRSSDHSCSRLYGFGVQFEFPSRNVNTAF